MNISFEIESSYVELVGNETREPYSEKSDDEIASGQPFNSTCIEPSEAELVVVGDRLSQTWDGTAASGLRKRRLSYTVKEKQDVISHYDDLGSYRAVSRLTGINPQVIKRWVVNRDEIESPTSDLSRRRRKGAGRKLTSPILDERLLGEYLAN